MRTEGEGGTATNLNRSRSFACFLVGQVAYLALRVGWFWSSFGFSQLILLGVMSGLNYLCLGMVGQALEMGAGVSGPQDVLFVNWAVMASSIFWDKAWMMYGVVRETRRTTEREKKTGLLNALRLIRGCVLASLHFLRSPPICSTRTVR